MLKSERKLGGAEPQPHESHFYHNLVPAYQAVWPAVARRRIQANLTALDIPFGASVLEVGVGTGMSLDAYPQHTNVLGVDLSEAMLAEAEILIQKKGWEHINVRSMNAEKLEFEDESFDLVTSFHTISVVSQPEQMVRELVRVCKPGGQILVINHFRSKNPLIARMIDSAGGITRRLGWRTDLQVNALLTQLPIEVESCHKNNPLSLFRVLVAKRV